MLKPSAITAIIDTREKIPYRFPEFETLRRTLNTGDYTILGLEDRLTVERKSLADYISTISTGRSRWDRQVERMIKLPFRLVIIEASWLDLQAGKWRSRMHPNAVMGSTLSYMARGVPMLMAGSREAGELALSRFFWVIANKHARGLL